jgi:GT2 family glycosyltransferase
MMPRRVYAAIGGLDEQFVPGFFEDDDYCLRVKELGLTIGCAEDVFVYHELSASFDKLSVTRRQAVFERNKALFEQKWGTWKPHVYRAESLH